jgi:predicted nucleic acid-binding protein
MQPVLFDSSVYISALRAGDQAVLALRRLAPEAPVWLSAVVLEELYAGASRRGHKAVQRLERDFDLAKRILTPTLNDWSEAGQALGLLAEEYGYEQIGRGRLTNDALIAVSAGRQGITVITANGRDFARLRRFRPFAYEVKEFSSC